MMNKRIIHYSQRASVATCGKYSGDLLLHESFRFDVDEVNCPDCLKKIKESNSVEKNGSLFPEEWSGLLNGGEEMNKTDFLIRCAGLAGWTVRGMHIISADCVPFSVFNIATGSLSEFQCEVWESVYRNDLFTKTIDAINRRYNDKLSNYCIFSRHDGFMISDTNLDSHGISHVADGDYTAAREEIIKKYFEVEDEK